MEMEAFKDYICDVCVRTNAYAPNCRKIRNYIFLLLFWCLQPYF